MTRKQALVACRAAGYHGDQRTWTRMYIENRVSLVAAKIAYQEGQQARAAGVRCSCGECRAESADMMNGALS